MSLLRAAEEAVSRGGGYWRKERKASEIQKGRVEAVKGSFSLSLSLSLSLFWYGFYLFPFVYKRVK